MDKDDNLIVVLGDLDELNSCLGLLHVVRNRKIRTLVLNLQDDLFHLGADLAGGRSLFRYEERIQQLESTMDALQKDLPLLKNFIIPGGSPSSSWLHLARSVARRLERSLVMLKRRGKNIPAVTEKAIKYTNRLSDLLFVMARYVNFKLGVKEVIWPIKKVVRELTKI